MDPQLNGGGRSPFMAHPAPEKGTWSMQDVSLQEHVSSPLSASTPQGTVSVPQLAADHDLIEREWVEAAKATMSANRDDPYKLCKALSALKVEYMKKRYGRQIKQSD